MASRTRRETAARRTTNYKTVAIALGVVLFAVGLFTVSLNDGLWSESSVVPTVLTELGGLLCVSAALTLLWELGAKREFLEEVWEKARVSDSVRDAGLLEALDDFQDLDWSDYLGKTNSIDVFFAGGTSFVRSHSGFFERLEETPKAEVNVFLPDPENETVVAELTRRFERYTPEKTRGRLEEAIEYFRGMRDRAGSRGAAVTVRLVPYAPLYTLYRCGRVIVVALYKHKPYTAKGTVPTFVFGPGSMYDYFEREIEYLEETGREAMVPHGGPPS